VQPFVVHGMLMYLSNGAESLGNEETRLPVASALSAWTGFYIMYLSVIQT